MLTAAHTHSYTHLACSSPHSHTDPHNLLIYNTPTPLYTTPQYPLMCTLARTHSPHTPTSVLHTQPCTHTPSHAHTPCSSITQLLAGGPCPLRPFPAELGLKAERLLCPLPELSPRPHSPATGLCPQDAQKLSSAFGSLAISLFLFPILGIR